MRAAQSDLVQVCRNMSTLVRRHLSFRAQVEALTDVQMNMLAQSLASLTRIAAHAKANDIKVFLPPSLPNFLSLLFLTRSLSFSRSLPSSLSPPPFTRRKRKTS
jgi:hypothetical protein